MRLEPRAGKLARVVPRRGGDSNITSLFNIYIKFKKLKKKNLDEPLFASVDEESEEYQKVIEKAQEILNYFGEKLSNLADNYTICVKTFIPEYSGSDDGINLWLIDSFFENKFCNAEIFEIPEEFQYLKVGQRIIFQNTAIKDWYILSDSGELEGGY